VDAGLGWTREPERRDVALVPSFAQDVLRFLLPGPLGRSIVGARLRWTPERVSFGTSYVDQTSRIFRYDRIIERPEDSTVLPTFAPREALQSAADVRFRPLESLTTDFTMLTTRDLLSPDKAVADPIAQQLISDQRARVMGLDLGWETNRSLQTHLSWQPRFVEWLRQDLEWSSRYGSDRNANFLDHELPGPDSVALARNASGQRDLRAFLSLDPARLSRSLLGAPESDRAGGAGVLGAVAGVVRPLAVTYNDGIVSRFERDPVSPDFFYQLGWRERGGFRFIQGDTAATLTDRSAWTVGSGLQLPAGMSVQVGYQHSLSTTLDTRSDRQTTEERWPDLHASLPTLTFPHGSPVQRVRLTSGLVRDRRRTVFGGIAQQERRTNDLQVPLELSVTWLGTLITSYRGSFHTGTGSDPTGDTQRDETSHRVSVTSTLVPPGGLSRKLDRPVRLSVLAGYTAERDCRSTAARPECVAFVDQLRRSLSLSLDTSVGGFEMGIEMNYDDRQSYVGQQTGSTQFRVGVFGQLNFSSGTFPATGAPPQS
jgi:hypothetical protein